MTLMIYSIIQKMPFDFKLVATYKQSGVVDKALKSTRDWFKAKFLWN